MTNSLFDLTGRSALVTGAAGGIGSAVAEALADADAAVLVTDLDKDAAAAVAERISSSGGRAESAALDVSDRESADAAATQAAALADGKFHILVNNAGVTRSAMFEKTTQESFRLLFDIHVMGAFNCTQAAIPYLPTDGTGRVINVTSAAGLTAPSVRSTTPRPRRASLASRNRLRANSPQRTFWLTRWRHWRPRR
jgi:3-oxoacyl-[acyl-carrier protein] reductase